MNPATSNTGLEKRWTQNAYIENFDNKDCRGRPVDEASTFKNNGSCMHFTPTLSAFKVNWDNRDDEGTFIKFYTSIDCTGNPFKTAFAPDTDCEVVSKLKASVGSAMWQLAPWQPAPTEIGCGATCT